MVAPFLFYTTQKVFIWHYHFTTVIFTLFNYINTLLGLMLKIATQLNHRMIIFSQIECSQVGIKRINPSVGLKNLVVQS